MVIKRSIQAKHSVQVIIYDCKQVSFEEFFRGIFRELKSIETGVPLGIRVELVEI